jgi:hypothetical protein
VLGLHDSTWLLGVGFVAFLAAAGAVVKFSRGPQAGSIRVAALVAAAALGFVMVNFLFMSERAYDRLDAAVSAKLATADIEVVEFPGGGDTVVVRKGDCRAIYELVFTSTSDTVDSWPLKAGTGVVDIGCPDRDLDKLFIAAS